jgi:hypothetical protein
MNNHLIAKYNNGSICGVVEKIEELDVNFEL